MNANDPSREVQQHIAGGESHEPLGKPTPAGDSDTIVINAR
jgi:hypothetical protein